MTELIEIAVKKVVKLNKYKTNDIEDKYKNYNKVIQTNIIIMLPILFSKGIITTLHQ